MEKPMSNSVKVSSFITYGSCKPKHQRHKMCHNFFSFIVLQRCMCARVRVNAHPDLAELHLNLFGDNISPVLLSKKVPEYPSQKSIDPGLRLRSLL